MQSLLETQFHVEEKPEGVFVAHIQAEGLGGLALAEVLESAAPVKNNGDAYDNMPKEVHELVAQFGYRGVFEAMNSRILKAHKLAFVDAWPRAYISSQLMRYCLEPLVRSPSMDGVKMQFPYEWLHHNDVPVDTEEELLKVLAVIDRYSGVSAEDYLLARVLGVTWNGMQASEWIQIRDSASDNPLSVHVPNSERDFRISRIRPPIIEPKVCWKEENGKRLVLGNAQAGLKTTSEPDRMVYQDGTLGLIIAAHRLGIHETWPKQYGFGEEYLAEKDVRKGVIAMEASQVPLLAQISASAVLNHPEFESLIEQ